ncbi:hypothetical protein [Xinzhou partiti-like virus 1]|uniref:hypothetical protein n=1 Tax=Xinzhou partiti-like virus 1 TaxID=1923776 RepID=UPI00090A068C|nr:hypothetical protein [Xinzhou partiti-like virus 1]APG78354.1 hypothetical protein [Xinzhou partiti-like virus 1]
MSKRPAEPAFGTPAKVMAGDSADAHTEVSGVIGQDNPVPAPRRQSANKQQLLDSELASRPKPEELNILRTYASNVIGPTPCHSDIYVLYTHTALDAFAKLVRRQILNTLYPDGDFLPQGVCSEEDWVIVVQYILKSRIDLVYANYSGRRPPDRVPLVRIVMPRSIASLINGIGVKQVFHGNFSVCPQPGDPPVDRATWLINLATHARIQSFSNLVLAALQRGVIHPGTASNLVEGTGWWLLYAANSTNRGQIATIDTQSVTVWAQFPEWTPSDGLLCAIAATGFIGTFIDDWTEYTYKLESVTDSVGMRASYAVLG